MSVPISRSMPSRHISPPLARIPEINRILGRVPSSNAKSDVTGVNTINITCDSLIAKRIYASDMYMPSARFDAGYDAKPSIIFARASDRTGIYTTGNTHAVRIAYDGAPIATFGPVGLILSDIVAASGTIDFHGATLVNIGGIEAKPGSYEVIGDPVVSVADEFVSIVSDTFVVAPGFAGATWDINIRIAFASRNNITINGAISFSIRMHRVGSDAIAIGAQYNRVTYCAPELASIVPNVRADGDNIILEAQGIAGIPIRWQGTFKVIMVAI